MPSRSNPRWLDEITIQDEDGGEKVVTVQEGICLALRAGTPLEHAAIWAGVSKTAVYDWRAKGEELLEVEAKGGELTGRDAQLAAFAEALKKARAAAVVAYIAVIRRAAPKQWTAAAWWLERTFPERFGRRVKVEREGTKRPEGVEEPTLEEAEERFVAAFGDELPDGISPEDLLGGTVEDDEGG